MQRREAHKDLKDQGELKKPGMTKRRQARKVATMVKRLKKNPEDGESQPPMRGRLTWRLETAGTHSSRPR